MTAQTPSFLAQRLAWVFRKTGGSGRIVRTFEEFTPETQDYLRSRIGLGPSEVPVLAAYSNAEGWIVLTTDRLVSTRPGHTFTIPTSEIHDATINTSDLRSAGSKNTLAVLTVVTSDGQTQPIDLEPGPPLVGVWNVLKSIGTTNQNSRS